MSSQHAHGIVQIYGRHKLRVVQGAWQRDVQEEFAV